MILKSNKWNTEDDSLLCSRIFGSEERSSVCFQCGGFEKSTNFYENLCLSYLILIETNKCEWKTKVKYTAVHVH